MRCLVTGAQGFIGSNLVRYLKSKGHWVRAVDIQDKGYRDADENWKEDLRGLYVAKRVTDNIDYVFHLASDVGGSAFIYDKQIQYSMMRNNTLIDVNVIDTALLNGVERFLYTSSSCVYPITNPDGPYGQEKYYAENILRTIKDRMKVRIVRFQNVYGPGETIGGKREKVIPALCRKMIQSPNKLEVWGDGKQVRSYIYVDDCVEQLYKVMTGKSDEPKDIGGISSSVNNLIKVLIKVTGTKPKIKYIKGVVGAKRKNLINSNHNKISLEEGLRRTYEWIYRQLA